MKSALLVPSERAPNLRDLKLALLTYDTVNIIDPSDRDLFPSTGMGMAIGMPPIMSLPMGDVRLLGKEPLYDAQFDSFVDSCAPAIKQGSAKVIRTYRPIDQALTIGMVDLGGFPVAVGALLAIYRSAASQDEYLASAIAGDQWLLRQSPEALQELAILGGSADGQINDLAALPDLKIPLANEALRPDLSAIARARVANAIKFVAYCSTQGLIPHGTSYQHDATIRSIAARATGFVDAIAEDDPFWVLRTQALRLIHEEYLNTDVLDQLSVDDVLRLRSHAWGRATEKREALLSAVGDLTRTAATKANYENAVSQMVRDYRQQAAEIEDEREKLNFRIVCELGKGIGSVGGATAAGALAQLQTGLGTTALILAGCVYAFQQIQEMAPIRAELKNAEAEFREDFRFGIHSYFSPMT